MVTNVVYLFVNPLDNDPWWTQLSAYVLRYATELIWKPKADLDGWIARAELDDTMRAEIVERFSTAPMQFREDLLAVRKIIALGPENMTRLGLVFFGDVAEPQ